MQRFSLTIVIGCCISRSYRSGQPEWIVGPYFWNKGKGASVYYLLYGHMSDADLLRHNRENHRRTAGES